MRSIPTYIFAALATSLVLFSGAAESQSIFRPDGAEVGVPGTEWRYQAYVLRMDDRRYGSLRLISERDGGRPGTGRLSLICLDGLKLDIQFSTFILMGLQANERSEVRVRFDSDPPFSVRIPRLVSGGIGLPGAPPSGGDEPDRVLLEQLMSRMMRASTFLIEVSRSSYSEVWSFRVAGLRAAMQERLQDCPVPSEQ